MPTSSAKNIISVKDSRFEVIESGHVRKLLSDEDYQGYGSVLAEYTSDVIDSNAWTIPVAENTGAITIRFNKYPLGTEELRLIKAFAVDILSWYSSPKTCVKHISNLEPIFAFLGKKGFRIEMLSTTVLSMFSSSLDLTELTDQKKNEIEGSVAALIDFMKAHGLLRPGAIKIPAKRKIKPSQRVTAPEFAVIQKLDEHFFNFDNPVPSEFRCRYMLMRLIPNRIGEVSLIRLDGFNIKDDLLMIEIPTFKEAAMHKATYEKYWLLSDGKVESLLKRALFEQQAYAQSMQARTDDKYKNFLMVSNQKPNRLGSDTDFNQYLKSVCRELSLTDYKGDPVVITSHALRHVAISAFLHNHNMPMGEVKRMSNHTRISTTIGYGYVSKADERKYVGKMVDEVHQSLEGESFQTGTLEPQTLPEKAFQKKQRASNARLLGQDCICTETACAPQYERCIMECEGYRPDPAYVPKVREYCDILEKRIEAVRAGDNTDLLDFNLRQLAIFQRFLERAEG